MNEYKVRRKYEVVETHPHYETEEEKKKAYEEAYIALYRECERAGALKECDDS